MKWYPYGHDFGNAKIGGVTVLSNGNTCSCSIPTAFAKADINAMHNLGIKVDQSNNPIHANALGYCNLAGRLLMRKVQANGIKV